MGAGSAAIEQQQACCWSSPSSSSSSSATVTMAAPWWAPWDSTQPRHSVHFQQPVLVQQQQQQQQPQQQNHGLPPEPSPILIGSSSTLDLGKKRAYPVEEVVAVAAAAVARKKQRGPAQPQVPPTCQVEGCNADLSGSKGYHRRHRVCEIHSKTPKNIVAGIEQRFCQQCSRFHSLVEFDEGKRSCRRRLAGHNERRRKPPQPDPFSAHGALSGLPIYTGPDKPHLLDGTFLLGSNAGAWPAVDGPHVRQCHGMSSAVVDQLQYYRSKPEIVTMQDSIASQGVYQFLKSSSTASSSSVNEHQHRVVAAQQPPGVMIPGALSLLSAEAWSSSASSASSSSMASSTGSKTSGSSSAFFSATHQQLRAVPSMDLLISNQQQQYHRGEPGQHQQRYHGNPSNEFFTHLQSSSSAPTVVFDC